MTFAEVQFEFRADGASVWTLFGPMFRGASFDSIFEPAPQAYGFFTTCARVRWIRKV
ncbi:MAG: hypothetical protein IPK27_08315 [Rhodanobacteraceae bacterium]|nr:hypothetical protein [Rhodanobacteraceae bacterium]